MSRRRGWWLAVAVLCLACASTAYGQNGNPRAVPNCASVSGVRPLATTLPTGVNYTVTVNGCNFGASSGTVKACNQATFGGTCATALVLSWSSTSISAVIRAGALAVGNTIYLYVTDASSNTNANGLGPFTLSEAAYWVRTDGNDNCNGTANVAGASGNCAWLTIAHGANAMSPGGVVRVQPGTYIETVTPTANGTLANPITLVAGGAVTTCGMIFTSKSYIRVIGFNMNPNAGSCGGSPSNAVVFMSGTNTGLEFWNNDIGNLATGGGIGTTNGDPDLCHKCIIVGGHVHDLGMIGDCNKTGIAMHGDDGFVGYVNLDTICYLGVGPSGSRLRILNLNFSGLIQDGPAHPDNYYISVSAGGFSNGLVEANYGVGTPTSTDNKYFHAQNDSPVDWLDDVWRFNVSYNLGSAFYSMYATMKGLLRWRFYNNTTTYGNRAQGLDPQFISCGNMSDGGGGGLTAWIRNTIHYRCWGDGAVSNIAPWSEENQGSPVISKDYNLAFTNTGSVLFNALWTGQAHKQTNVDPGLVNVGTDFTLTSGAAARGAGGPLTTAVGAGVSSTSLTVAANTGSFFIGSNASNLPQYGGALVPGDPITVGTTTVQVASVSGDVLTLASPISWSNGDPVCYGTSCTVDLGAYPFKSGGYALSATFHVAGGTATIAPNDAGLVRFVACFNGKIPYAVINAAPYTCAVPAGAFQARVYSRYASPTRWVNATPL